MGDMTIIKDGVSITIHADGSYSSSPVDKCDYCDEWVSTSGGLTVRDIGQEILTWLCAKCRA